MSKNYKQMYQQKCNQLDETNMQFTQYQEQSNLIITDLEEEVKQLKKKNEQISRQLTQLKQKRKTNTQSFQKQIQQTKKQRQQFKSKFMEFEKKFVQLENINQCLQSDLRATKTTLSQYEQRTEKTMEQLALLQIQMEESTQSNQQQIARLKSQLKQTQDQLYALHHVKNKSQKTLLNKQNINQLNESLHSSHGGCGKKGQINESKVRKKNIKFSQTLSQIRTFIALIQSRRSELTTKFQQLL